MYLYVGLLAPSSMGHMGGKSLMGNAMFCMGRRVCAPVSKRGLGFSCLHTHNVALLMKFIRKFTQLLRLLGNLGSVQPTVGLAISSSRRLPSPG
jgi:hypothetical protein